jgi:uncharacterized protein (TIGR02246 family)
MHSSRLGIAVCVIFFVLGAIGCLVAQQPARTAPAKGPAAPAAKPAPSLTKDATAIQQSATAFREAFNRGDAKAVAALWTKDGEFIDADGQRFEGRAAIEKQYSAFFAAHPAAKITLLVDAIRPLSDSAAIEDGRSSVEDADSGQAGFAKYTVVHVKSDGKWSMSSVRETPAQPQTHAGQLRDIDWLIGSWSASEGGATMTMECRWVAGKRFIERTWSVTKDNQSINSGVQIIGVGPQSGAIQSWTFASDGGLAMGAWTPRSGGWAIESSSILTDGSTSTAVNLIKRIDDNSFSWRSVNRSLGGVGLPDGEPFVLKRAAARQ